MRVTLAHQTIMDVRFVSFDAALAQIACLVALRESAFGPPQEVFADLLADKYRCVRNPHDADMDSKF
jgi:hypothetical protein